LKGKEKNFNKFLHNDSEEVEEYEEEVDNEDHGQLE